MTRKANYPINPLILNRWSPRAMSGQPITKEELMSLFEAARWAPSSYNNQPWRFVFATRDMKEWEVFLNLLVEENKAWATRASALIVVASKKTFEFNNQPTYTHSFDTGAACENVALQASHMHLVAHALEGFDHEQANRKIAIPSDYAVEIMFAIGKPGKKEDLPPELQKRESPNDRRPLNEIVFEGAFGQPIDPNQGA